MARRKTDIVARKERIEEQIAALEEKLPELRERARQAEDSFRELNDILRSSDRSHHPELKRRHKAWQEAEDELNRTLQRIQALKEELADILAPATAKQARDHALSRLEEARKSIDKATKAIERLEARLEALEDEIRETDGIMQEETGKARLAALEGKDHALGALIEAKKRLELLRIERKTVNDALEDARRMLERARMAEADAASDLRQAEGEVALFDLADLLRKHRDIVYRIDAAPGVNTDRVMSVFDRVLREG